MSEFRLDTKNTEKIVQVVKDVERLGDIPLDSASQKSPHASVVPASPYSGAITDLTDVEDVEIADDLLSLSSDEGATRVDDQMNEDVKSEVVLDRNQVIDSQLQREMIDKVRSPEYLAMNVKRQKLPAFMMKQVSWRKTLENESHNIEPKRWVTVTPLVYRNNRMCLKKIFIKPTSVNGQLT